MAPSSTSLISAASSSSTRPWKHDVFLSFRGEDTRYNLTGHLHAGLKRYGINTFIDNRLKRGEHISSELLQAIEESRFSIVIFSESYASSSWCLDELSKIIECQKSGEHTVFPVFYNVDPSHVRNQRGSCHEVLAKHEETYKDNMDKVLRWREALTVAAGFSGWDCRGRPEYEVVEEIASHIFNKVNEASACNVKYLVGRDFCVQVMLSLLSIGSTDVKMIGVWGMAGVGKTAIVEVLFQRIYNQFEAYCFVSNIREKSQRNKDIQMEVVMKILGQSNPNSRIFNGGINLIGKALRYLKVLIILDDVNHIKQLEALVGDHKWFGPGSRIIITTRDKRLLVEKKVDEIFEIKELDEKVASQLFCQHAFGHKSSPQDFVDLCYKAVNYAKGLPLALDVLGRFLYKRSKVEWESELEKLKSFPNTDIQNVLRISYDGLDDNQKEVFLDIACFFNWDKKDYVIEILRNCGFFPEIEINILKERSLITIDHNERLRMHDLIQEMGHEIIRKQSIDLGRRNRLWMKEDIKHVLATNSGTESVEGIVLHLDELEELHLHAEVLERMNRLRVLRINVGRPCLWASDKKFKFYITGDLNYFSNNLRSIHWDGYPLKSLPSKFDPQMLVELNMTFSQLKIVWEGNKSFPKLKFINLSHSKHLKKTPDFSGAPELRRIILEGCINLAKVHPSLGTLKKLSKLNLVGCSKLNKLLEIQGNMESLKKLDLSESGIREIPESIQHLNGLVTLGMQDCKKLKGLPESICKLTTLKKLYISGCSKLKKWPNDIGRLQGLVVLYADDSGVQELPASFAFLTKLEQLSLSTCKGGESKSREGLRLSCLSGLCSLKSLDLSDCNLMEGAVPNDLGSLSSLEQLSLSGNSLIITLPASLSQLRNLRYLNLVDCQSLRSLPELPPSIQILNANNCTSLETFSYPPSITPARDGISCFKLYGCLRLRKNEGSDILKITLSRIRVAPSIPWSWRKRFTAMVPGSEIPEWFIHQSEGNSVALKLPPDCHNNTEGMGLTFCAVVGGGEEADHIWFGYQSLSFELRCGRINYLQLSVGQVSGSTPVLVVKKCGFRLVYIPCWRGKEIVRIQDLETIQYDTVPSISCPPSSLPEFHKEVQPPSYLFCDYNLHSARNSFVLGLFLICSFWDLR